MFSVVDLHLWPVLAPGTLRVGMPFPHTPEVDFTLGKIQLNKLGEFKMK